MYEMSVNHTIGAPSQSHKKAIPVIQVLIDVSGFPAYDVEDFLRPEAFGPSIALAHISSAEQPYEIGAYETCRSN